MNRLYSQATDDAQVAVDLFIKNLPGSYGVTAIVWGNSLLIDAYDSNQCVAPHDINLKHGALTPTGQLRLEVKAKLREAVAFAKEQAVIAAIQELA